jgi:pimeloyl-ACP methyl ester carboxylesterase
MDGLGIDRAHIVGLSMGAFASIHFGLTFPERARSIVATSCGYGTEESVEKWQADTEALATKFESDGPIKSANDHASSPYRIQLQNKDRRSWTEFRDRLADHSTEGMSMTMRGVHKFRPPLVSLEERLRTMRVPLLVIAGDEDVPVLEPALFLKRTVPTAALAIFPRTGHSVPLEEPILFTETIEAFMNSVNRGRWEERDVRTLGADTLGLNTATVDADQA